MLAGEQCCGYLALRMSLRDVSILGVDPVVEMLLTGQACTLEEAEERYLNEHLEEVIALVRGSLTEAEFRRHPLIRLLLARGSRGWEDSLT